MDLTLPTFNVKQWLQIISFSKLQRLFCGYVIETLQELKPILAYTAATRSGQYIV